MKIPYLPPHDYTFPNAARLAAEYDGLVGVSGDLDAGRLLSAYRQGIFPWFSENGLYYWFTTDPRTVLLPEKLHIGRSLAKTLRNKSYRVTVNTCFSDVIAACSAVPRPGQDGTWITPDFQTAYGRLHRLGHAHSFECRLPDEAGEWRLAGGFYGVQIGRVFYGESMFARMPDASKIAFACAVPFLERCGVELIDCQQDTEHLKRFGSQQMDFHKFHTALVRLNDMPLKEAVGRRILADNVKRQD